MLDIETKSLWSHILGQAMDGKLKGKTLEIIPGEMVTWKAWREQYPKTTVLNLPPTRHKSYTNEVYKRFQENPNRRMDFVYGAVVEGAPYHRMWNDLMDSATQNLQAGETPVLALTDKETTSVWLMDRRVGDQTLTFKAADKFIVDQQTQTRWTRRGEAVEGPLKGKTLKPVVGLVSFEKAWNIFHPKSKPMQPARR